MENEKRFNELFYYEDEDLAGNFFPRGREYFEHAMKVCFYEYWNDKLNNSYSEEVQSLAWDTSTLFSFLIINMYNDLGTCENWKKGEKLYCYFSGINESKNTPHPNAITEETEFDVYDKVAWQYMLEDRTEANLTKAYVIKLCEAISKCGLLHIYFYDRNDKRIKSNDVDNISYMTVSARRNTKGEDSGWDTKERCEGELYHLGGLLTEDDDYPYEVFEEALKLVNTFTY